MPAILLLMGQAVPQFETGVRKLQHVSMESEAPEVVEVQH